MNKVMMMGRLTKKPEMRYAQGSNTAVCRFSIAVDRRFDKENADFFECTAFGKTAEFVEKYFDKGNRILLDGSIQNNNYTNKDGQKIYAMQIIVSEVEFCESKGTNTNTVIEKPAEATKKASADGFMDMSVSDDELPFNF